MSIRLRGISYHFEQHQENSTLPTLLLLHGFLGSSLVFKKLVSSLCEFCNPITLDLLGHGKTEGAEMHYRFSTKEQVADLSKLISEQFNAPIMLFGYSMGARLALQLAMLRADLVEGLLLESGTFGIEEETERQARQALDASRADQIMGNYNGFLTDWRTKPLFQSSLDSTSLDAIFDIQVAQNPVWMANSLLGFGTGTMPCVRNRLSGLICPTHLIVGKSDSKFIHINQVMNKEIPNSALSIVEDSNHRVHLEQPEQWTEIVKNFITNH